MTLISTDRISRDIEAIASFSEAPPAVGFSRPTFSVAWREACDYVIEQARSAGCDIRVDPAGNIHARPSAIGWHAKVWLSGSHLDSVPTGGKFDGVIGVVCALEVLRATPNLPLELIIFAEEEGTTFGIGMIGSRLWASEQAQLASYRDALDQYVHAGAAHGVDLKKLESERCDRNRYFGLIEIHIEQGPGMWQRDQSLAVVSAIAGRRQYCVTVRGQANHAGATSMTDRRDALAGAAAVINGMQVLAPQLSEQAVITVGRLLNFPNAVNVIPDRVEFTIDFRAPSDETLTFGDSAIRMMVQNLCERRGLACEIEQTESIAARPMDEKLVGLAARIGGNLPTTISGALHDSAVLAPHLPTVMLFVASRDGISHNPAEFSRAEDIAAAASLLAKIVGRATVPQLNSGTRDQFVDICGGFFEHSPWVAERAWERRPFASIEDLHSKMTETVAAASSDEQLALIRAHPDLVGKLAREGRLTRESTSEQSAAGLTALSESEIAEFEHLNAAYREKFDFPFIICARENRKDAILAAFPARLENDRETEIATALVEIGKIAKLRMLDAISEQ